ncbi:MAG: pyrroloquinoline quinone precursor peptide PqqA, partial [Casimicrobiaceae bacterium]
EPRLTCSGGPIAVLQGVGSGRSHALASRSPQSHEPAPKPGFGFRLRRGAKHTAVLSRRSGTFLAQISPASGGGASFVLPPVLGPSGDHHLQGTLIQVLPSIDPLTSQEDSMRWTSPSFTDLRFGFEITMYIAHR